MPTFEQLRESLPDYAKDLRLNLSSLATDATLNDVQRAGTFIACAIASRNASLTQAIIDEFGKFLTPEALNGAKAASAMMGMNNVYYRFLHIADNKEYSKMPARLRMNIIANPGCDKVDFELWCLAVSAINACGMCIDSHEANLRKHNIAPEVVHTAVRISAVVHATACVLDAEEATSGSAALAA